MNFEREIEDGDVVESSRIKKSRYQIIPAEVLESHRKDRLWGYLERNKMNNPVYYRLMKDERFIGFKRVITEYLSPGSARWQLNSIPHDAEATQKLSKLPMGIATLGREKIISDKQRRVTNPRSKDQSGSDAWDRGRFIKNLNEEPNE